MPQIRESEHFIKAAQKLPKAQKQKLAQLILRLRKNPTNPLLHSKQLSGSMSHIYSFRITREWRATFQYLNPETILLLDVAHRKDIYR